MAHVLRSLVALLIATGVLIPGPVVAQPKKSSSVLSKKQRSEHLKMMAITAELYTFMTNNPSEIGTDGFRKRVVDTIRKMPIDSHSRIVAQLYLQESDWYESASEEDIARFNSITKEVEAIRLKLVDQGEVSERTLSELLEKISQLEQLNPKSMGVNDSLDWLIDQLLDDRQLDSAMALIKKNLLFLEDQWGQDTIFRQRAQMQLAICATLQGDRTRGMQIAQEVLGDARVCDPIFSYSIAVGVANLGRLFRELDDDRAFDWSRKELARLASHCAITECESLIQEADAVFLLRNCRVSDLFSRGKDLDPGRVETQQGLMRLVQLSSALVELGEIGTAIQILEKSFSHLGVVKPKSDASFSLGLALAQLHLLANDAAEARRIVESIPRHDAKEWDKHLKKEILILQCKVELEPGKLKEGDFSKIRQAADRYDPAGFMQFTRRLNLAECKWRLHEKNTSAAKELMARIIAHDVGRANQFCMAISERIAVELLIARQEKNQLKCAECEQYFVDYEKHKSDRRTQVGVANLSAYKKSIADSQTR